MFFFSNFFFFFCQILTAHERRAATGYYATRFRFGPRDIVTPKKGGNGRARHIKTPHARAFPVRKTPCGSARPGYTKVCTTMYRYNRTNMYYIGMFIRVHKHIFLTSAQHSENVVARPTLWIRRTSSRFCYHIRRFSTSDVLVERMKIGRINIKL